ncbi:MAG: ADP-ribosylglycohydrolase family protein [Lachnospiraceae bacterium]|nr:ADP-ribosylglycohydrolase family protein [Lachnospiraceae bacterium]
MIGAIIGDVVGSRFERNNIKTKDFALFSTECRPTDDSVMSLAIANAILEAGNDYAKLSKRAVSNMQKLGRKYKNAGYGGKFRGWLFEDNPSPYNSFGNGAGMRVGPCGFAATTIEEAKLLSASVTMVTHNHPEGMKGAEAVAVATFLAKDGMSKEDIRKYIQDNYYDVNFTIDGIRDSYKFDVSCQGSVPQALVSFFDGNDFEDTIRNAISIGGDSDTIAAMAGAVAEAYYGVPKALVESVMDYLEDDMKKILGDFEKKYPAKIIE